MSGKLLTGQIAKAIFGGFKGHLLTGTLRREVPGTGNDEYGDPNPGTVATWPMEGFTENYDDAYRARAGIPQTDLMVNIFAESLKGTRPQKDDQALFEGQWYQLRGAKTDPATALWTCQAFEIAAPT